MKKEYQNPSTSMMLAVATAVIMASPYKDLGGGGLPGGLSVPARKVYV